MLRRSIDGLIMSVMENIMQMKTALANSRASHHSGSLRSARKPIPGLAKLVAVIKTQWTAIDGWQRRRQMTALLHRLDDHSLADIGIHRSQTQSVVRNGRQS